MRRFVPILVALPPLATGCNRLSDVPVTRNAPVGGITRIVIARAPDAHVDTLRVVDGTAVLSTGYGSAIAADPNERGVFYLLTDRGPNVDAEGGKAFPVPDYSPRIMKARMRQDTLWIEREISLRRRDGTPVTGRPIGDGQCGSTGELPRTIDGRALDVDPHGLDSEGLAVMRDGTFWISDEYGPFLAQFDSTGRELQRLSPCDGGLPRVYSLRRHNGGMEGLTVTPDGKWIVGIMQAPLDNPTAGAVGGKSRLVRMLFRNVATGAMREYAYLLDSPDIEGVSGIVALSDVRFLVVERDDHFLFGAPQSTIKRIYEVDVSGALDISAPGTLGAKPIAGGRTLEQATVHELEEAGIVPVAKTLRVDLLAAGYPHNKSEGLALFDANTVLVTNDDDFGITDRAPSVIGPKQLPPANKLDFVEAWKVKFR